MKFEYDFAGRHSLFRYYSSQNEVLDKETWKIIESKSANRNLLPVTLHREGEHCVFAYDISGTVNMMAWREDLIQEERDRLEDKIQKAVSNLTEKGIPHSEIMMEKRYMYAEIATGEVKLVCIPVKQEEKKSSDPFKISESERLPLIPPEPKGNLSDEIFEMKADSFSQQPWRDVISETEEKPWEKGEALELPAEEKPWEKGEAVELPAEEKPWEKGEAVELPAEEKPWEKREAVELPAEEKTWEKEKAPGIYEEDNDSQTVLLRDDGDNETILLKKTYKIHAELVRERTQEIFSITVENCKLGKRALMTDICIRNNPTISREHCVIRFREGEYYIEDLNSSNYTYLNGIRVMPAHPEKLEHGDRIRMSDEEFIFRKES